MQNYAQLRRSFPQFHRNRICETFPTRGNDQQNCRMHILRNFSATKYCLI